MKRLLQRYENRICLAFFVITMIIATSPLISRYCINGHDIEYHLLRIESLKEGILIGHPFQKVNSLFFGGAGYASTMFYSDIFMHIPALLRVMHVSIGRSFHIYTSLLFVLCYISTFYSVWKMSMSKFAATVAAVVLTLCPYHMDDMLVRTACGENTAFIFLHLAVYGVFNVLYEDMDRPWVFGLGFAGLLLSHPATCLLAAVLAAVAFLIHIKKLIRDPRVVIRLGIVSALAILVTSYQWLPMIEQFSDATFYVSDNWTDLLDTSVGFANIASNIFPCVGFVLFALIIPRAFLSRKDYPILSFVDLMIVAALVFAVGATNIMPWEHAAKYFGFLQFPWRLFMITSVLLAMADAIVIKLFVDRISDMQVEIVKQITLIVITVIAAQLAITHQSQNAMGYYDYSDDYYSYKGFTGDVIGGEWLPAKVYDPYSLVDMSEHMVYDDGTEAKFTREKAKLKSDIETRHEYVDVPFLYYKGYKAILTDASGEETKLPVSGDGDNGMCRVELGDRTGELTVYYAGTPLQIISLIVSHLFLLLIFDIVYLKNKYRKKLRVRAMAAGANLGKVSCMIVAMSLSAMLCSCSVVNLQKPAHKTEDLADPDDAIDLLKNKNGEGLGEFGISGEDTVKVNFSKKGYDADGKSYVVKIDESSGEEEISIITVEEALKLTEEEITVKKDLYKGLLSDEVKTIHDNYKTEGLKERIMHETDALLCLEVFPEKSGVADIKKLAKELGDDILIVPDSMMSTVLDRYNCAAVLAKAAYVIDEWDKSDEASQHAEALFSQAEKSGDEGEPVAARLWAAAELYRLTGSKTYRSVVDSIAMDVLTGGFSYEEPGCFGLFAYLMSPHSTNYNVCTNMMDDLFDEANSLIKEPIELEFTDTRVDYTTKNKEEDAAKRMLDEAFLVTMTNYVSVSVEYKGFVENRLNFIYGANLSGVDFTADDEALCDAPKLFVLAGL